MRTVKEVSNLTGISVRTEGLPNEHINRGSCH